MISASIVALRIGQDMAMHERRFGLRAVLTVLTIAVTSLALTVLVLLLIMTQYLNRVSATLAHSIENVRAAEETQIALLMHERGQDPPAGRAQAEAEMLKNLALIRSSTTAHNQAVERAEQLVNAYIQSARTRELAQVPEDFAAAFRMLDEVSDLNVAEARAARDTAVQWDRRLNLLGWAAMGVVLALTASLLWWMRTHAFQPVFELARAMERFARGDHDARAEERGPNELREMVERFNEMAAALAAQRQAQVAFLAGVAHDLRNPISALSLSVALIAPDQPLPPEPSIRRTIELVRRQLKKLERMVSDFMDVTKVQAGELGLQLGRHDLVPLVREVVDLFDATEPEPRIAVSLPHTPVWIEGDALRIEQIITNLISNALKYSPGGSKVEVGLRSSGGEATLYVRDHGIGISEEDQRRLFEPFQRAGLSKDTVPGAGLGLYVVQRLVQAHGGRIDVVSRPGDGAEFSVHVPLAPADRLAPVELTGS
jgi:two-component system, OmpR family, sensor histidine kinase MtrB